MASALTPCATLWPVPENSKVTVRDSVKLPILSPSPPPRPPAPTHHPVHFEVEALSRGQWRTAQCSPLNALHWTLTGPVRLCLYLPHSAEAPPAGKKDMGGGGKGQTVVSEASWSQPYAPSTTTPSIRTRAKDMNSTAMTQAKARP